MEKLRQSLTPLTRNIIIAMLIILIAMAGGLYYFYSKSKEATVAKNPKSDLEKTVSQVGRLMVLPTDETPTMATVSDPEKLKDQPFFTNAKAGDKVLIYSNARKAILYSPTQDKIIEVAPVNLGATASQIKT
jgi:hypothetical protein